MFGFGGGFGRRTASECSRFRVDDLGVAVVGDCWIVPGCLANVPVRSVV